MDLRLFVAIEPPPDWLTALAAVRRDLDRDALARLRWARAEGIHLTLKFLGAVDERRVGDLTAALTRVAAGRPRFTLTLGALGMFGSATRPRVLWTGVTGEIDALLALWTALERETGARGFAAERGPLAPHLTLARVREGTEREVGPALRAAVAAGAGLDAPPLTVDRIALMRSELGPGGAHYSRIAAASLSGDLRDL